MALDVTGDTTGHAYDIQFDTLGERDQFLPLRSRRISCSTPVEEGYTQYLLYLEQASRDSRTIDAERLGSPERGLHSCRPRV
jgi:hypothetical protein